MRHSGCNSRPRDKEKQFSPERRQYERKYRRLHAINYLCDDRFIIGGKRLQLVDCAKPAFRETRVLSWKDCTTDRVREREKNMRFIKQRVNG